MTITNYTNGIASWGVPVFGGGMPMGIGNVYFVCKTTDTTVYNEMYRRFYGQKYDDDSAILHTSIASALTATVECRNDYVIVQPSDSDYDITAELAMDKKSVHLICPAGLGYSRGSTNACRIEQTTAATGIFALTDAAIEIAGFYLKPYASVGTGTEHMTLSTVCYGLNIHHNFFVLKTGSTNVSSIEGTGAGGAWGYVAHHNFFQSMAGDDKTTATMIQVEAAATGARVDYNDFFVGDGNTYTVVVQNLAVKGSVNYNNFMAAGSDATMTHCIQIGSYGCAIGNRGAVGNGAIITGGAADVTNIDNMNAVDGGTIDDLD